MHRIKRRSFLKASGVCLALPWLESLAPRAALGAEPAPPRRMVCICSPLGIHAENLFPKTAGTDYELTPYLEIVQDFRSQFTVISGLSHPDVGPSHDSMASFLTGAPHPEVRAGFQNSISLDQLAAEQMRGQTRHDSLALASEAAGLAWTRSGAPVPTDFLPSQTFKKLFVEGSAAEVAAEQQRLQSGRSILDMLAGERSKIRKRLGKKDAQKMDEYLTSIRELEQQLAQSEKWARLPKPKVDMEPPQDPTQADIIQQEKLWYDLIHLALQTDSTRLITLTLSGLTGVPTVEGVSMGYHDLSHHGQDPAKLAQLRIVEVAKVAALNDFLKKLQDTQDRGQSLLDSTMVFFSSNLGNASSHDVKSLPIVLAGGGFKHGQHLAFDADNPPPLCNLYVSMLQRLGLEFDQFSTSTGTLTGLEFKS